MKSKKGILQKIAYYSGIVSFLLSIASLVFLYVKLDAWGWNNPITASLMASSFFFVSVGLVLVVIGKSNLPGFKVGGADY